MITHKLFQTLSHIVAAVVVLLLATSIAKASGHFISGLQGNYPAYDLNDTYVFKSSNKAYTSFISSVNPGALGSGFGDGGLYSLHIAGDEDMNTGMTLVFSFKGNNVEIRRINEPNTDVGTKGVIVGSGLIGDTIILSDGIRIWTGKGKDPFFGNGAGLAKFNAAKQMGKFEPALFKEDGDLFVGATAGFIVVDIPNKLLGKKVYVFTTTAVEHKGEWVQVDRHANVLFPYVFLSDTPAMYEDHEQHRPDSDVLERRQAIVNNVYWAVETAQSKPDNAMTYSMAVADMVIPDLLTYQVGSEANYAVTEQNGRALHDDAMNTVLQLMTGVAIDDNAYDMKRYTDSFPYIISVE